jgi:hypothetical protein
MNDEYDELKLLQDKFRRLYKHTDFGMRGGIFRTSKRKQLLGLKGRTGRDRTKADFRYKNRLQVKTALIDLQLFIQTSDDKDVDNVLNRDTLEPVIRTLLFPYSIQEPPKQGAEKAKTAQLLIEVGFEYLRKSTVMVSTSSQERKIDNCIGLSKQLTLLLLPENERAELLRSGKI